MTDWIDVTRQMSDGAVFVKEGTVNLNDLCPSRPGMVVRCAGDPRDCAMIVPAQLLSVDFVAGMISEE